MEKTKKIALIQRSLGLRHKLKVHESLKAPETHEELSVMLLAKWELEDELAAIEELLAQGRKKNVQYQKDLIAKDIIGGKKRVSSSKKKSSKSK